MKVRIKLLRPFRDIVGSDNIVLDVAGSDVRSALASLSSMYPALKKEIYTPTGEVEDYVTIFHNGQIVSGLNDRMNDGDDLIIFVPISGG